ncbi:MAG: hypothetical protein M0C28_11495 [Candidatus Moduliflexus flocculans]|nr:hypothetical protein [Candidatus Moduliflexus flocculans]
MPCHKDGLDSNAVVGTRCLSHRVAREFRPPARLGVRPPADRLRCRPHTARPDSAMLLCQISDPHIVDRGTLAYGKVDTPRHARALRARRSLPCRAGPTRVVATGDLTDHGTPDEYGLLAETARAARPCRCTSLPRQPRRAQRAAQAAPSAARPSARR